MTVPAIQTVLTELGIEFDRKTRKTTLVQLLLDAGRSSSPEEGGKENRESGGVETERSGGVDNTMNSVLSNMMSLPHTSVASSTTATEEGSGLKVADMGGGSWIYSISGR